MQTIVFLGKSMRSKVIALLAVTLIAALVPAVMAIGPTAIQAALNPNHSTGPPGTVPCTFDHPTSMPSEASSNATDALADRSSHCPPTIPTHKPWANRYTQRV